MNGNLHAGGPLQVGPSVNRETASVHMHGELARGDAAGRVDGVHPNVDVSGHLGGPGARRGGLAPADCPPAGPSALLPDELVPDRARIAGDGQAQLALVPEQGRPAVGSLRGEAVEGEVLRQARHIISRIDEKR